MFKMVFDDVMPPLAISFVDFIGTGFDISGNISGDACTYTAAILTGEGNSQTSGIPANQTMPSQNGMLASFTGLEPGLWQLYFKASCEPGGLIKITQIQVDAWVGEAGRTVTNNRVDDNDTVGDIKELCCISG